MRVMSIIVGIIMIFTSVWCFAHSGASYLSLAFLLGVVMFFHGITLFLSYFTIRKTRRKGPGWLLGDGSMTTIMSILVLFNMLLADSVVPVFFGLWIMFSGILRIVSAINEKWLGDGRWLTFLGAVSVAMGIYLFFDSLAFDLSLIVLVGSTFLLQGINMLYFGASSETDSLK